MSQPEKVIKAGALAISFSQNDNSIKPIIFCKNMWMDFGLKSNINYH